MFLQFGIFSLLVTAMSLLLFALLLGDFWFPGWMGDTGFWKEGSLWLNVLLILGFGIQHSVMARKGFKQFLAQFMPPEVERNFYVMWSGFFLLMVAAMWHREQHLLVDLRSTPWGWVMLGLSCMGWLLAGWSVLAMDGLGLVGLRHLAANLRGVPLAETPFRAPGPYRVVRHPLYLGMTIGFWFSPCYSVDSLLFAACFTVYLQVGMHFEEKDLKRSFGAEYEDYSRKVPRFLPWPGRCFYSKRFS